jgi:hypothetical protein
MPAFSSKNTLLNGCKEISTDELACRQQSNSRRKHVFPVLTDAETLIALLALSS